jgi:tetratricopeptide (TPR) repeat protein
MGRMVDGRDQKTMSVKSRNPDGQSTFIMAGAAVLMSAVHLIPLALPDARLWGINHLLFLPPFCTYLYAALAALTLMLFFEPLSSMSKRWFERASALFETDRKVVWVAAAVAGVLVFWFLRMPINMLGDGCSVINNIGGHLPVVFKWSEVLAIKTVYLVSRLVPYEGLKRGEYAYAIISVLSGGVTLFFFLGLAYESGRDKGHRLLIFCLLLFSGWLLLFFGYAENYPILWPLMTGYLYFSVRYIAGRSGLALPSLLLLIGVACHLQVSFFAISYPVLLISRGWGLNVYRRHKRVMWLLVGAAVAAGIVLFIYKYTSSFGFMTNFLPPFQGRPATPQQAMFSPQHWLDIVNEFSLVIPLWLVLVLLSWRKIGRITGEPVNRFLLAFSAGGLAFVTIIDPRLGMGRDWDLFALIGLGPALLLIRNIDAEDINTGAFSMGLICFAFLFSAPFIATNIGREPALAYYESLLRLDRPRSHAGAVILYDYYKRGGDKARADSLAEEMRRCYPARGRVVAVDSLVRSGNMERARQVAESLYRADPYSGDNINQIAAVYSYLGRWSEAKTLFGRVLEIRQYDARSWLNLYSVFQKLGMADSAVAALRKAQRLDPHNASVLFGLTNIFLATRQYDSVYSYALQMIAASPDNAESYFVAGAAAYQLHDVSGAKKYLGHYVEGAPSGPKKTAAENILKNIP